MHRFHRYISLTLSLVFFYASSAEAQQDQAKREAYLEELIELQERPSSHDEYVNFHDASWLDWVERTGALPPNFEDIPSLPFLPDPLILDEGGENIPVKTQEQWKEKRAWIKEQVKHIISGTFPEAPEHTELTVLDEKFENGVKVEMIVLKFGKNDQIKLTLEIMTPPGEGPFPVFMTQWNHRGWAQIALRRGYIGVVYAGADAKDDTQAYLERYPEHDWSTLMRRAWGAQRAVDYLYTLPSVDTSKIAITGHSRNGKQSLLAAAFDERIDAVISSSGGTGGEFPYRYTDERHSNESIEFLNVRRTHWFHPRIRFYTGREHKMPIDQNSLMALIAPDALLLSSSIREGGGGDAWAVEQMYLSLRGVYEFLGVPEKLGIRLRDGGHGVSSRDIEAYVDWLDIQFGRKDMRWENKLFYHYSFDKWKDISGENIDPTVFPVVAESYDVLTNQKGEKIKTAEAWQEKKEDIKKQINWVLGDEPAGVSASPIRQLSRREDYITSLINRPSPENGEKMNIAPYNALGDYLYGSLYYPTNEQGEMKTRADGKIPVVIYLHKYSNTGFDAELTDLFENILSRGMAVLAMDMIGFGTRIEEGTYFYQRYPHWSKLGKMVSDTRAAIDALETLDFVDQDKVYLAGYSLGGTVSLFTAALDDRVTATAVVSAYTPLRDREGNEGLEGIKAYSHLYGLLPRLGFFLGNENRLPVDYNEIISAIAPKPLLVIAPELDRHADFDNVRESIKEASTVYRLYDAKDHLEFKSPHEFSGFTTSQNAFQREMLVNWLDAIASDKKTESIHLK
ncbi:cephalosporin-C deacetylase-like acetyl esterase [Catalinimonas alkaloidigena]|uniref:glucuronyl esterase domain-containing protein n=1 Tax=Catalinimonas alkaloidigena TaxID=1075417 RepID=UPI00240647BF|nr:alpha/beta fold hydrolase [Catalinimonas alkaloidigena]MDF9798899.1 cephalosporin-C deacetylase-like acetyl esterase [Catalinimonas alkaloidigena]